MTNNVEHDRWQQATGPRRGDAARANQTAPDTSTTTADDATLEPVAQPVT